MTNGKNDRKKKIAKIVITIIILIVASALGINLFPDNSSDVTKPSNPGNVETTHKPNDNPSEENPEGTLILTMIDVGQADSFFFQEGEKTALIDCGTRSSGDDRHWDVL